MITSVEVIIVENAHIHRLKPWVTGGPKGEGPRALSRARA